MRVVGSFLVSILLFAPLISSGARSEDTLRIAVAANFKSTLDELTAAYSRKHPTRFIVTAGATGALYAQIHEGAPFDLFFCADRERALLLEQEGLAVPDTRKTYAAGQLVLWTPGREIEADIEQTLRNPQLRTLAIANPETAPYGAAAQQVLQKLKLTDRFKLLRGESIGQTFQFLATGNADAGFVARSQIVEYERANHRSIVDETLIVSPTLHTPILQDAILLRRADSSSSAHAFLVFVWSPEARRIIRRAGYTTP